MRQIRIGRSGGLAFRESFAALVTDPFLTTRGARLSEKLERYAWLKRIIKQRAAATDPDVPGGDIGLMI